MKADHVVPEQSPNKFAPSIPVVMYRWPAVRAGFAHAQAVRLLGRDPPFSKCSTELRIRAPFHGRSHGRWQHQRSHENEFLYTIGGVHRFAHPGNIPLEH
jgi:hypothetical protein